MAKKKTSSSRYADQAALQTLVRFGPQLDVLKEAQRTAESTYQQRVQQAHSGAQAVIGAVDQSAPQMAQIYDRAGLDQARTSNTLIGHDLAGLSGVADSIKAGASLEAAGMAGRLGEARAASLGDLQNRKVGAAAGEVAAGRAAGDELVANLTKILQSKKDLSGQSGAFAAATIGDLAQAARDRALRVSLNNKDNSQSERNSVRSSGIDPNTGQPIPGGKLDPKAKKNGKTILPGGASLATANEHGSAKDAINQAKTWIRRLGSSKHLDENTIKDHLVAGDTLTDDSSNKVKLPSIPADYVQAAWEMQHAGGVSSQTAAALHARGLSLKQLGLVSRGSRKGRTTATVNHGIDVVNALVQSLGG